jgi:Sec-independent protein translocase protein TatA
LLSQLTTTIRYLISSWQDLRPLSFELLLPQNAVVNGKRLCRSLNILLSIDLRETTTMFDVSWGEIVVVMAAGVCFVGRQDLPRAAHTVATQVGRLVGLLQGARLRADQFASQNELRQLKKEIAIRIEICETSWMLQVANLLTFALSTIHHRPMQALSLLTLLHR